MTRECKLSFTEVLLDKHQVDRIFLTLIATGALMHCFWECNLAQLAGKAIWINLAKLKMHWPYDQ